MNIDELKNAWGEYDKSLESKINFQLLKEVSMSKTLSLTRNFRFTLMVEGIISALFVNWMAQVVAEQFPIWQYWVPALVIGLCSLWTVIWNVRTLIQIGMLKYDANITEAQKKLERIHVQNDWRKYTLQYLTFPIITAMMTIMALKFLDLDLASHLLTILYAIICGLALIPLVIWIERKFPDKEMQSAVNFLKEIKEFEKE